MHCCSFGGERRDKRKVLIEYVMRELTTTVMRRLHDPTVGPTGQSNRSVQQLDQQLRRVNGRPTGWSNRLDESNMSKPSNRLN